MKDYYATLEVSPLASDEEIKKAYRRLVLKYHPDRNQGNARALRKMQEINIAFEVLGDPEKRKVYDPEYRFSSQEAAADPQPSPMTEADQGDAEAQYNLGVMYYDGEGVTRDYQQAFTWFKKAAAQGHAEAQYRLGKAYYEFHGASGVPKNDLQAALWYRRAADQGHVGAQTSLGVLYYNGEGVPQDYDQAALWLQKAADQGDAVAQMWLNRIKDLKDQPHESGERWGKKKRDMLGWGGLALYLLLFFWVFLALELQLSKDLALFIWGILAYLFVWFWVKFVD